MQLCVQKTDPRAVIPTRSTEGSAGYDLRAVLDEPLTMQPGQRACLSTGIAVSLPSKEYVGLVFARSGLAVKHGLALSNGVGVIDSDYTGEIKVGLVNLSQQAYQIQPGERIAQFLILPIALPEWVEVDSLSQTERGSGGFGSTGKI